MSDKLNTVSTTIRCDMCHIATIVRHFEGSDISTTSVADVIRSTIEMFVTMLNNKDPELEITRTSQAATYLKSRGILDAFDKKRSNYASFIKQLALEEEFVAKNETVSVSESIDKHLKKRENNVQNLESIDMSKINGVTTVED